MHTRGLLAGLVFLVCLPYAHGQYTAKPWSFSSNIQTWEIFRHPGSDTWAIVQQRRSAAAGIRLDSRWQDIQSAACSAGKICVLRRPVLRRVRQPVRLPAWAAAGGVSLQGPLPRGVHRRRVDEDALHPAAGVPDGRLRRVGQPAYAQPYQRPGRHVARKRYEAGDLGRPVDSLLDGLRQLQPRQVDRVSDGVLEIYWVPSP